MGCAQSNVKEKPNDPLDSSSAAAELKLKEMQRLIKSNLLSVSDATSFTISNPEFVNTPDLQGFCPLHWAASNGNLELLRMLADRKAHIDAPNSEGNTALHLAIEKNFVDCAIQLKLYGCNENVRNNIGSLAKRGTEGNKSYGMAGLLSSTSLSQVDLSLSMCEANLEDTNLASFVDALKFLKLKFGTNWTSNLEDKAVALFAKLEKHHTSPDPKDDTLKVVVYDKGKDDYSSQDCKFGISAIFC